MLRIENKAAFADALLGARLPGFEPADRRLITRLVLGTTAWRARLDYEIEQLAGRPALGIQPQVLMILRMGLFQLRFLDRIPPHAVVDTSVALAKMTDAARIGAGFINAMLRRAARETISLPARGRDEAQWLAISYSHPRWLAERFIQSFGVEDAEHLMAADNEAAPNTIRLNLSRGSHAELTEKLETDGIRIAKEGRAPETLILDGAPDFTSRAWREGLFHAQSETSQLVARMLGARTGTTVLDCAA
ncbi:MAG TPA: transcription antitermination factor NusB, partial [Candidatus Binataceae bacterium]|nr:transcription antitermination factor NusB [Candidatus Binataceae bacterium]